MYNKINFILIIILLHKTTLYNPKRKSFAPSLSMEFKFYHLDGKSLDEAFMECASMVTLISILGG